MRLGADTGGTFTDFVDERGGVLKVPSSPADPAGALSSGISRLDDEPSLLAHGTTVATNALLERRGGRVALVTNVGMADVVEIARQDRPSLYDHRVTRPEPLVRRDDRLEVPGRLDATGAEIEPVEPEAVAGLPELTAADAVAVSLLHADLNPAHERAVARVVAGLGVDVTCSHEVSPEFREYERTVTTVINAYLRPVCGPYLRGLAGLSESVRVMSSAGGLLPLDLAADLPVALLLSGPAAGVQAAAAAAAANGFRDAVTFDMGGTSTDVGLVMGGRPEPAGLRTVDRWPVRMPSMDIHTIGAGGGSIASIDPGGALTVGPRSAGAEPGPACYGRGGIDATVTDADLVMGRIPADHGLPGLVRLDRSAAERALEEAGVTAQGVVSVVNAQMEQAVRRMTVERGIDPRGLALVAFGGAGPLHAAELAGALGMSTVIVPARAGVFSAVGLLCAAEQRDLVMSWSGGSGEDLDEARSELARRAAELLGGDGGETTTSVDCRYRGQSHELTVDDLDRFHELHEQRNGYSRQGWPVEVIAVRARAERPSGLEPTDLPELPRERGAGPRVVAEQDCTIWVPEGWTASRGEAGALLLTRSDGP